MEFIDYLDSHFDLDWVSGGSQVKVSGQCPFCGEERSDLRMYVNVETGIGICFHCGVGFNGIKFVMANESCGWRKAVKILSDDRDDWDRYTEEKAPPDEEAIFPPMVEIAGYTEATEYLVDRGMDIKLINHFKLKFCVRNVRIHDRLFYTKNRVIIPIHDISGEPASWQGRDITGHHLRYLFPPGFQGANYLFNAWALSTNAEYLIISEGVFDAFGWWRAGFKNVVATFGKKISEAQVDMLRYLNPKVIFIAWDSDAMWENQEFIEKYGYRFNVRVIDLGGKDADEMGREELIVALSGAKGYSWEDKILSKLK